MDNHNYTSIINERTTKAQIQIVDKSNGCQVSQWYEGWTTQQPSPDRSEMDSRFAGVVLREYKNAGFTTWYSREFGVGYALRGRVTRVDLIQVGEHVRVDKFPYGWTLSTPPISSDLKPDGFTLDQALDWFSGNRAWTVRTWPGGARAWLGPLIPVRTKVEIIHERSKLQRWLHDQLSAGNFEPGKYLPGEYQVDLAFDM